MSGQTSSPAPSSQLRHRREELAEQVAELHWNLGGLTYEMAIRDHFRLDVLIRRAAMLQERDAELAEVDRLLHMQESSVAGSCESCGAVRSRGAVFCWQCGAKVMEQARSLGDETGTASTRVEIRASGIETTDIQTTEIEPVAGGPARVPIEPSPASALATQELGRPLQASP
jgi:uncharacterized Zn finger protein (UPF0148 family)